MKNIKNDEGSVVTAAVIVLLVVLLLSGAMYMVGGSYYRSSINNYSKRQAYLYAKGECSALANYLVFYGEESSNPYYVKVVGDSIALKDIEIRKKNSTKKIDKIQSSTGSVKRTADDQMDYTVTVTVGGQSSTVTLSCKKINGDWQLGSYS